MESARGIHRLSRAAGVLAVLTASCATGGSTTVAASATPATTTTTTLGGPAPATFELPDVTARPLTTADLAAMLPAGQSEIVPNADLITLTAYDTDDAASDVLGFGRETGVATSMTTDAGLAHVWIDLLADADLAHRYLLDTAGDVVKRSGGTHSPEVGALAAEEFPISVGEEAIGLIIELDGSPAHETAVIYRLGRLVIYAGLEHPEGVDLRVPLQYLAEDIEAQVIATLTATPDAEASPAPPSYRFETTITAEAESGTWLVERSGISAGGDLSCTVRTVGPDGEQVVEIRRIAGTVGMARGDGIFSVVGAGNVAARSLLAACDSWPLDAGDAGLQPLMGETTTRHHVNGINALGYTPEPSALATVLGIRLDGVSVESFSFWVAENTPWIVEVEFVATGDAAILAPALPDGWSGLGVIRLAARHRVFDLDTAGTGDAGSPTAPRSVVRRRGR